jgi:hypothetical protein
METGRSGRRATHGIHGYFVGRTVSEIPHTFCWPHFLSLNQIVNDHTGRPSSEHV